MPLEPPRAVRAERDRLRSANPVAAAVAAARLGADDRNAPFLRFERVAAITAALGPIESRIWARHRERAATWANDRRLDLLCEYLAGCPAADVPAALDLLLPIQRDIDRACWPPPAGVPPRPGFVPGGSLADLGRLPRPPGRPANPAPPDRATRYDAADLDGRRVPLNALLGDEAVPLGTVAAARTGLTVRYNTRVAQ